MDYRNISQKWKKVVILLFLKPGKPSNNVSNYRPIALTSCVGKLLEKIVNVRLMNQFEKDIVFTPYQYEYRKMHSAMDTLTRLTPDISHSLHHKEYVVCVFFHMEKVYDTAWRFGILKALHKTGIQGALAVFVKIPQ